MEGTCGRGSEGGLPSPYVARKKSVSAGVGHAAPCAPAPEVVPRVVGGTGGADTPGTDLPPMGMDTLDDSGGGRSFGQSGGGGRPIQVPGAKAVLPAVRQQVEPAVVAAPSPVHDVGQAGCSLGGTTAAMVKDPNVAGDAVPVAKGVRPAVHVLVPPAVEPVHLEEGPADSALGGLGWTTVGNKGKNKKAAGQSATIAVQQQNVGEQFQGDDPMLGRVSPFVPRWKGKGKGKGYRYRTFSGWMN